MPLKIPAPRGRPSALSRENLLKIIADVALGATLRSVCSGPGQPSTRAFRAAVAADPELREQWEIAKAERPHNLFEEAIDMARELHAGAWGKEDTNRVGALRVAIDALREAAARMAPREYGQRPASHVVVPVQINTTLDLSPGKPQRATSAANIYAIDLELPGPEPSPLSPKGSADE